MRHDLKDTPCRVSGKGASARRFVPERVMKSALVFVLLLAATGVAPAMAGSDGSLPGVRDDLSPEDLARVAAVTRPTADFSRPEEFEKMQGGGGTSRRQVESRTRSRNPRPTSPSRRKAPSSSATGCSARCGCRRRRRRRRRTASGRCSTRGPARAAISRTVVGIRRRRRRCGPPCCSGWRATPRRMTRWRRSRGMLR